MNHDQNLIVRQAWVDLSVSRTAFDHDDDGLFVRRSRRVIMMIPVLGDPFLGRRRQSRVEHVEVDGRVCKVVVDGDHVVLLDAHNGCVVVIIIVASSLG